MRKRKIPPEFEPDLPSKSLKNDPKKDEPIIISKLPDGSMSKIGKDDHTGISLETIHSAILSLGQKNVNTTNVAKVLSIKGETLVSKLGGLNCWAKRNKIDFQFTTEALKEISVDGLKQLLEEKHVGCYELPLSGYATPSFEKITFREFYEALQKAKKKTKDKGEFSYIANAIWDLGLSREAIETAVGAFALWAGLTVHQISDLCETDLLKIIQQTLPTFNFDNPCIIPHVVLNLPLVEAAFLSAGEKGYKSFQNVACFGLGCFTPILKNYLIKNPPLLEILQKQYRDLLPNKLKNMSLPSNSLDIEIKEMEPVAQNTETIDDSDKDEPIIISKLPDGSMSKIGKDDHTDISLETIHSAILSLGQEAPTTRNVARVLFIRDADTLAKKLGRLNWWAKRNKIDFQFTTEALKEISVDGLKQLLEEKHVGCYELPLSGYATPSFEKITFRELYEALQKSKKKKTKGNTEFSYIGNAIWDLGLSRKAIESTVGAFALWAGLTVHQISDLCETDLLKIIQQTLPTFNFDNPCIIPHVVLNLPLVEAAFLSAGEKGYKSFQNVACFGLGCFTPALKNYLIKNPPLLEILQKQYPNLLLNELKNMPLPSNSLDMEMEQVVQNTSTPSCGTTEINSLLGLGDLDDTASVFSASIFLEFDNNKTEQETGAATSSTTATAPLPENEDFDFVDYLMPHYAEQKAGAATSSTTATAPLPENEDFHLEGYLMPYNENQIEPTTHYELLSPNVDTNMCIPH